MPGFDYKFLEKPKRRFQCPLCSKAMREPVQVSTCGHRFCDTCLQEFLRYSVCVCVYKQRQIQLYAGDTLSSFFRATVNGGRVGVSPPSPFLVHVYSNMPQLHGALTEYEAWFEPPFICACAEKQRCRRLLLEQARRCLQDRWLCFHCPHGASDEATVVAPWQTRHRAV